MYYLEDNQPLAQIIMRCIYFFNVPFIQTTKMNLGMLKLFSASCVWNGNVKGNLL